MKNQRCGLNYLGALKEGVPTVIFVPGTLISPVVFREVAIPEGYQAAYISWMDSEGSHDVRNVAEKLAGLIQISDLGPVILAGYSSGGSIVMLTYLALKNRELVKGMLLSNTGANNKGHGNAKSIEEIKESWDLAAFKSFLDRCFVRPIDKEMYAELHRYGSRFSPEERVEPLISQREIDLTDSLGEIECPVLIAHGRLDKVRTPEHAKQLAEGIKDSELIFLDAGHSPMAEDSGHYSEALGRLAEKIKGAASCGEISHKLLHTAIGRI